MTKRDHRSPKPLSRRDKHRAKVLLASPKAPGPKFAKERKHRPHPTPLRDALGAFTRVGRYPRRVWVAGVSAQEQRRG
jgi:hypothetical protein